MQPAARGGACEVTLYFALLLVLSAPFLALGMNGQQLLPKLPASALMILCPALSALILSLRSGGIKAAGALARRGVDVTRVKPVFWFIPILLFSPLITALAFFTLRATGVSLPALVLPAQVFVPMFVAFLAGAICEEIGWTGYALEPLQKQMGELPASIVLGVVWAAWHIIPLLQVDRAPAWIAWWALGTISTRIVMVWIFNRCGKSVFAMSLMHTMSNLCWMAFPVFGSRFDPEINGSFIALAAILLSLASIAPGLRAQRD